MGNKEKDICTIRPFERNRYFYGKLLTVRDFETEQSYFRGKDALINRIILNGGIVCGLEVTTQETGTTVNISAGVAIDCCGREIVVSENTSVDLEEQEDGGTYYLYLKYKECYKESVPVLADPSTCEEKCAYNRMLEIFEVIVSDQAPEEIPFEFEPELLKGDPAQNYYEQYLTTCPECAESENAKVLLAVVDKTTEGITKNDNFTRQHRVIVPNNPMLYKLLNIHTTDLDNPHETTAEQVGALVSVDGVENPGGDVDLIEDNAITISADDENNTITIGETHSARTDNPHETTAEQVGAPVSVDGVENPGGDVDLIEDNAITISADDENNTITIGETHSARTDNPHETTAEQVGALVSIDGVDNPGGNIDLVEGDNITITPDSDGNSITIAAEDGLGFEEDLTTLEIVNWKHDEPISLGEFMGIVSGEGLRVNFMGGSLPVNFVSTPNEVFLVAAKIPLDQRERFDLPIRTYHYEYLPGDVTLEDDGTIASFRLDDVYADYLQQMISLEQEFGGKSLTILVNLKCDFIIDANGKAVDGHHIGGTGQSGLIRERDGTYVGGIRGGVFESWLHLVPAPEATITLNPTSGRIGEPVTVTGQNFGPNETVQILFGDIQLGSVTTDAQGNFVMSFNVPDAPTGLMTVQATGEASGRVAEAQFTVIASVEEKIYWAAAAAPAIQRANLDGTNVEDIVGDVVFPRGIAVDAINRKVYWTDGEMGTIQNADLDGSNVKDVVTGLSSLMGIAVDAVVGRKIYWTNPGRNLIQRANLDGSNMEGIAESGNPIGITVDTVNRQIYWTDGVQGEGRILSTTLDGLSGQVVVEGLSSPRGIDVDTVNKKIYWTEGSIIRRANFDGAEIEDIVTGGLENAIDIAVDAAGGKIYWTDPGVNRIQRANLDGTDVETIVTQIADPQFIAIFSVSA